MKVYRFAKDAFTPSFSLWLLLLSLLVRPLIAHGYEGKIVLKEALVRGREGRVSFQMVGTGVEELEEVIKSGIRVTFRFDVLIKRVHRNWFDRTVGSLTLTKEIHYDPVAKESVITLNPSGKRFLVKDLAKAMSEFFSEKDLVVPLSEEARRGKTYEIFVRARLDQLEIGEVFGFLPFIRSWFEVKTEWAHVKVKAR
ncbi:MAG: DUF4390 domain-containing protein [Deltaproteobacteria bacterium]|nr:MAG: DUF4390 domain-containing protein [Deltaproteobacteria bacterium]